MKSNKRIRLEKMAMWIGYTLTKPGRWKLAPRMNSTMYHTFSNLNEVQAFLYNKAEKKGLI